MTTPAIINNSNHTVPSPVAAAVAAPPHHHLPSPGSGGVSGGGVTPDTTAALVAVACKGLLCHYCQIAVQPRKWIKLLPCNCLVCHNCFIHWILLQRKKKRTTKTTNKKEDNENQEEEEEKDDDEDPLFITSLKTKLKCKKCKVLIQSSKHPQRLAMDTEQQEQEQGTATTTTTTKNSFAIHTYPDDSMNKNNNTNNEGAASGPTGMMFTGGTASGAAAASATRGSTTTTTTFPPILTPMAAAQATFITNDTKKRKRGQPKKTTTEPLVVGTVPAQQVTTTNNNNIMNNTMMMEPMETEQEWWVRFRQFQTFQGNGNGNGGNKEDNSKLSAWMARQMVLYANGTLRPDRRLALQQASAASAATNKRASATATATTTAPQPFSTTTTNNNNIKNNTMMMGPNETEQEWWVRFRQFQTYQGNGNGGNKEDNAKLSSWMARQMVLYANGTLRPDRRLALQQAAASAAAVATNKRAPTTTTTAPQPFSTTATTAAAATTNNNNIKNNAMMMEPMETEQEWWVRFRQFQTYQGNGNGNGGNKEDNSKLSSWMARQMVLYANGTLRPDRRLALQKAAASAASVATNKRAPTTTTTTTPRPFSSTAAAAAAPTTNNNKTMMMEPMETEQEWWVRFRQFQTFQGNGNGGNKEDNAKLSSWMARQMVLYANGTLRPDRRLALQQAAASSSAAAATTAASAAAASANRRAATSSIIPPSTATTTMIIAAAHAALTASQRTNKVGSGSSPMGVSTGTPNAAAAVPAVRGSTTTMSPMAAAQVSTTKTAKKGKGPKKTSTPGPAVGAAVPQATTTSTTPMAAAQATTTTATTMKKNATTATTITPQTVPMAQSQPYWNPRNPFAGNHPQPHRNPLNPFAWMTGQIPNMTPPTRLAGGQSAGTNANSTTGGASTALSPTAAAQVTTTNNNTATGSWPKKTPTATAQATTTNNESNAKRPTAMSPMAAAQVTATTATTTTNVAKTIGPNIASHAGNHSQRYPYPPPPPYPGYPPYYHGYRSYPPPTATTTTTARPAGPPTQVPAKGGADTTTTTNHPVAPGPPPPPVANATNPAAPPPPSQGQKNTVVATGTTTTTRSKRKIDDTRTARPSSSVSATKTTPTTTTPPRRKISRRPPRKRLTKAEMEKALEEGKRAEEEKKEMKKEQKEEKFFRKRYLLLHKEQLKRYVHLTPEERVQIILGFHAQHGHFHIPRDTETNKRLVVHCADIQLGVIKIDDADRERLIQKGFIFPKKHCTTKEKVQMVLRFRERTGHFNIAEDDPDDDHKCLRGYILDLQEGRILAEESDKLLLIDKGLVFPRRFSTVKERVHMLLYYHKQNGHFDIPKGSRSNKWLRAHYYDASRGEIALDATDREIFQGLGVRFQKKRKQANKPFKERVAEYAAYCKEHNVKEIPYLSRGVRSSLGEWVSYIRNKKTFKPGQREMLDAVGFVWENGTDRFEKLWNTQFEDLKAYKAKTGTTCVPWEWKENKRLSEWVHTQRKARSKGILRADREKLLDDIGFVWSPGLARQTRRPSKKQRTIQSKKNNEGEDDDEEENITSDDEDSDDSLSSSGDSVVQASGGARMPERVPAGRAAGPNAAVAAAYMQPTTLHRPIQPVQQQVMNPSFHTTFSAASLPPPRRLAQHHPSPNFHATQQRMEGDEDTEEDDAVRDFREWF